MALKRREALRTGRRTFDKEGLHPAARTGESKQEQAHCFWLGNFSYVYVVGEPPFLKKKNRVFLF